MDYDNDQVQVSVNCVKSGLNSSLVHISRGQRLNDLKLKPNESVRNMAALLTTNVANDATAFKWHFAESVCRRF